MSVRVFVANDHEVLRGALRAVINMQSDMEVVGEAATGPEAEIGIKKAEPDVVLMDISMPNGGGPDAIAAGKRIHSRTRTVVLTFQEELGYIRAAGKARAIRYVAQRSRDTELLAAIRAVAQKRALADD
jgi:DNA-binding NarL/FixJ family response regulator